MGGCQCGVVRYEIAAASLTGYACHCRECQKQSASAFGVSVPVREEDFALVGQTRVWSRPTDSGSITDCHFCPQCGSRLYHSGRGGREWITVKGGSLDDPSAVNIVAHIWVKRAVPWITLPKGLPQWDTQPQTLARWRELLGWNA
ncbi:MAG: GFA family protein [Pseudomonadota bacterium]